MIEWTKQLNAAFGVSFLWLICLIYFTQVSFLHILLIFIIHIEPLRGIHGVFFCFLRDLVVSYSFCFVISDVGQFMCLVPFYINKNCSE